MSVKAIATFVAIFAISITTGSAIAQTAPAHECIDIAPGDGAHQLTNNCSSTIRITGRHSNGLCEAFETENDADEIASGGTFNIRAPAEICVGYADSATQIATGLPACDADDITGCPTGIENTNKIIKSHPTKVEANIVLSPTGSSLAIDEEGSGTFTVTLSSAPVGSATVALSKTNADITLSPTSLTFTADNYNEAQTVTVSAAQDDDLDDDQDTITLSASGGIDADDVTKSVDITDNDLPFGGIVMSHIGNLVIDEGGSSTFTIALDVNGNTGPKSDTTVTFSKINADITLSPTSMTFTKDNYETAQTLTVSAAEDDDNIDDQDNLIISGSGGILVSSQTKVIRVTDNEAPSGEIIVTPSGTLTISEGSSGTFSVTLSVAPKGSDATVSLSKVNSDITLSSTSLTFTADNYDTAQIITVSASEDSDSIDDQDTITLSASGGIEASNASKLVAVTDPDPHPGSISVTPAGALSVDEGDSAELRVVLSAAPKGPATVTLAKTNSDITLSSASLTFTADNYNVAQIVTVSAAEDDDVIDDQDTITFSASGGIEASNASKSVNIDDNDAPEATAGVILVSPDETLSIDEGGSADLSVTLSAAPDADTRVAIENANSDITLSSQSLTFTVDNYNVAQIVTVSAQEDDDTEDDQDTITFSASGGFDAANVSRSVSVEDNDTPPSGEIILSPAAEIVVAEGETGRFTVALDEVPTGTVTIALSSPDAADIGLPPTSLIFTPDNYDSPQIVLVTAAIDEDAINEEVLITLTASGGLSAPDATFTVLIEDTDIPDQSIISSTHTLYILEGESKTFTISLATAPGSELVISHSILSTLTATQGITISPSSLTFTPANWSTPQTLTASVAHDSDDRPYLAEATFAVSTGSAPARPAKILIDVFDDEAPPPASRILISPEAAAKVAIDELTSFEYSVSLSAPPTPIEPATITFTVNSPLITVEPYTLTFNWENYHLPQTVTVRALYDDDETHNVYEIKASAGPNLNAEEQTRQITVNDITGLYDPELLLASAGDSVSLTPAITEGETERFHVYLSAKPDTDVRVSLSTDKPDILTLSTSEIVIPRDDWLEKYPFDVTAASDDDTQNVDAQISASSDSVGDVSLSIVIKDTTGAEWEEQAQAPAIPPSNSLDHATLRVRCKQESDCDAYLFCTSQDGEVFEGVLDPIPGNGTLTLTASQIEEITSGSWSGKGRLNCEIRGKGSLDAQVWTRSGDGVLVNNSPVITSRSAESKHRASVDSISSPATDEITNVRIRCAAPSGENCTNTRLDCYDDEGIHREVDLGTIDRYKVRHLQSSELSGLISYVWDGLGLSCDITSDQPFSVQVLTRTGSGALVNNSGCK